MRFQPKSTLLQSPISMSSSVESTFESPASPEVASDFARTDLEKTVIRQGELIDIQDVPIPTGTRKPMFGAGYSVDQLIGQQLDHFLIESLVGTGGMGAVFRGRDLRLERVVAIKVVPIADRGAEAMRRFRVEAQSAAKLDHPHIARVYYVGETELWSYIVFEFVEGTNLRELVFKQGLLSIDDAVCLTRQIAEALQHAHERCVVHRDIKPSNILITQSGQAKLVDMGLARTTELGKSTNDLTASGVTLGTFDYISPEQAHDPRDADVRSDIYSLGCTLYFLLTGQPPFPEGTALQKLLLHGTKMPDDPRFYRSDISDSMIAILRKMMAKKPADRYQVPEDLIHDLQTLAQIEGLTWTQATDNLINLPSAFQRTWLEATLPLIVSVAAILAVTMWLHYTSYQSSTFPIPREEISEVSEPKTEVEPSTPSSTKVAEQKSTQSSEAVVAPAQITNSLPTSVPITVLAKDTLIVDPDVVTDKDRNPSIVRTIEQAIELASNQSQIKKIVVKGNSITTTMSSLKSSILLPSNVTIQSETGKRCRWNIDGLDSGNDGGSSFAWLDCSIGSVTFQEMDIVWRLNSTSRKRSLFSIHPNAWLQFKDCTVTVQSDPAPSYEPTGVGSSSLPSVFVVEQSAVDSPTDPTASSTTSSSRLAAKISGQRFVVRGQCDWMKLPSPVRTEVQLENGLIAISGAMFELVGTRAPVRTGVALRIDLRNVTAYTQRAWMRSNLSNAQPNPIPFVRIARDCIFTGCKSYIEWNASECQDWRVWEQSNRGQELTKWIDLRGTDNVYDAMSLGNLMVVRMINGKSDQIELASDAEIVAEERGLDTAAAWKKRPILEPSRIHETTIIQFEWIPGAYQPGFPMQ